MKPILAVTLFFLLPVIATAHTKWFVDDSMPLLPSETAGIFIFILSGLVFITVAVGVWLEKQHYLAFDFINPTASHSFPRAASTFTMITGIFLIIASSYSYLFAPNLTLNYGIPIFLLLIQIFIGLAFLLGIASRVSGILLCLIWASLFYYTGWIDALENIWVLTTGIFITLMGNAYFSLVSFSILEKIVAPYKKYALSILRIGTGATLMILGLSEKILSPQFGLNFLEDYQWNFMQLLGFSFSDYLFTLSAGTVEFIFGLVFVLGIATRLNALAVAVVFSIPLFILGPIELAGHLPHFAAIFLLLFFGNGGYYLIIKDKNTIKRALG